MRSARAKALKIASALWCSLVAAGGDVEFAARGAGERMKEVTQHLGGQFTDAFATEFGLPFEADAAPEVDERMARQSSMGRTKP